MILIYIVFCLILLYIYKKTNLIFSLFLGLITLLLINNNFNIHSMFNEFIFQLQLIFSSPVLLYCIAIVTLLFFTSNILVLINYDSILEKRIYMSSNRKQLLIVLLLSFFSKNANFDNLSIVKENNNYYKLNGFLIPFMNIFALYSIFIFLLIYQLMDVNLFDSSIIFLGLIFNLFIIWWIIKNIIDINNNRIVDYPINKQIEKIDNYHLDIKPIQVTPRYSLTYQLRALFIFLTVIAFIGCIMFIEVNQFLVFLLIISILLFSYSIYLVIKNSYNLNLMSEDLMFSLLQSSFWRITKNLILLVLMLMLSKEIYTFFEKNIFFDLFEYAFILISILIIFLSILFKNYIMPITLTAPLMMLLVNNNDFISSLDFLKILIVIFSLLSIIHFLIIINWKNLTQKSFAHIIYTIISYIINISIFIYFGFYIAILVIIIESIIYFYFTKQGVNKIK